MAEMRSLASRLQFSPVMDFDIARNPTTEDLQSMGKNWGWIFATGLVLVGLGALAFAAPFATSLGLAVVLGGLLIATGAAQFINAYQTRQRIGSGTRFFHAGLSVLAGALVLKYPGGGMLGIAMLLSFYFFVSSVFHWSVATTLKPAKGWGWEMVNAATSLLLGLVIMATFPFSALWVPGLLLGINLVVIGSSMIGLSLLARRYVQAEHEKPVEVPYSKAG